MRSTYFILLFIICNFFCQAQKRLYYGFHLGPSYASTQRFYEDKQHPNFKYITKIQPAMGFMMEYWLTDYIGARINLKRLQIYADAYTLDNLLAESVHDSASHLDYIHEVGVGGVGLALNKNYYDLSLQFRLPIKQSRFYVRQAIGLVLVPNIKKYWYEPYTTDAFDYPLLSYRSYLTKYVSNKFNYGFSANLGLDYKFGKIYDRYFYLNLDYTKCFVENERWETEFIINGQNFKAGSRSYGDYFSAQIGYKAPWSTLRSKKKREELKSQNR